MLSSMKVATSNIWLIEVILQISNYFRYLKEVLSLKESSKDPQISWASHIIDIYIHQTIFTNSLRISKTRFKDL